MTSKVKRLLPLVLLLSAVLPARAQVLVDTLFSWQGYAHTAHCRLRVYATPPGEARSRTVVLQELAENEGRSTVADARHLVELVGRHFGIDPTQAYWVFHWGAFSYEGARPDRRKELLLRATFRRNKDGSPGAPLWRVVTRADVEEITDRRFR